MRGRSSHIGRSSPSGEQLEDVTEPVFERDRTMTPYHAPKPSVGLSEGPGDPRRTLLSSFSEAVRKAGF